MVTVTEWGGDPDWQARAKAAEAELESLRSRAPRVRIEKVHGAPVVCKVWINDVLQFEGVSLAALALYEHQRNPPDLASVREIAERATTRYNRSGWRSTGA